MVGNNFESFTLFLYPTDWEEWRKGNQPLTQMWSGFASKIGSARESIRAQDAPPSWIQS